MNNRLDDPYQLLNVPYCATDVEIKEAFQKKLKEHGNAQEVIEAYGKIRDPSGREKIEWGSIRYCSAEQPSQKTKGDMGKDLEGLIRELAFCTTWELGHHA